MNWKDRIETTPNVLAGKPIVAGTRIPVELVVELLAEDWSPKEILDQYPALSHVDIHACLHYASERLQSDFLWWMMCKFGCVAYPTDRPARNDALMTLSS